MIRPILFSFLVLILGVVPAKAEVAGKGDIALTVYTGNQFQFGNEFLFYDVGYFVTDEIMPYGSFQHITNGSDYTLLRGGARFYGIPGDNADFRTFVAGDISLVSAEVGNASSNVDNDRIDMSARLGAEYYFSEHHSVSAQLGAAITVPDEGDTGIHIGRSRLETTIFF